MHTSIWIFLFFLAAQVHAAKNSIFDEASKYFSTNDTSPIVLMMLGLSLVLIVGILVLLEIRKADHFNRRKMEVGWNKFHEIAVKKKLSPKDVAELEIILRTSNINSADAVFGSPLVFENAIEQYITSLGNKVTEDEYERIHHVRQVLNYDQISVDIPYISTRQLSAGLKVLVKSPHGSNQIEILEVNERNWVIQNSETLKAKDKMPLRLSLTRFSDGEYSIKANIIQVVGAKLVLEHSRNLSRKQLRNWVRVDISIPARLKVLKTKNEETIPIGSVIVGRISDISGGGVSLKIPAILAATDELELDFELNGHKFRKIAGHIIRVSTSAEGKEDLYQHSLEFNEMESQVRERIIRFVFDKQRLDSQWR